MTNPKETLETELKSLCISIESVTSKQIASVKREQAEILEKMKKILVEFEELQKTLPKNDLNEGIDRINRVCQRIENLQFIVNNINQRADRMAVALDNFKQPIKQGNLIDVSDQ